MKLHYHKQDSLDSLDGLQVHSQGTRPNASRRIVIFDCRSVAEHMTLSQRYDLDISPKPQNCQDSAQLLSVITNEESGH